MSDLRQRLAEALSRAATSRGYRLRDERFALADAVLPVVTAEKAAELRRLADERQSDVNDPRLTAQEINNEEGVAEMCAILRARADELDPQGGAR